MLKIDGQLFAHTNGKVGQILEDAVQILNPTTKENDTTIFGALLKLDSILLTKEKAQNIIFSTIESYWGDVDLFLHAALQSATIDIDIANERLHTFLSSTNGKKVIFDYLLIHNYFQFEHLMSLVFGKDIKIQIPVGGLNKIYLYPIGKKLFLHIIYNDRNEFWNILFIKKVYSIFVQAPLEDIQHAIDLMQQLKMMLEKYFSLNQSVVLINELIKRVDNENIRSYQLKELHLFNLISHFNGGKRHYRKVKTLIEDIFASWGKGKWALSEKENTLLTYILAVYASKENDTEKVIEFGKYLIYQDRLINHSIELLVEYGDVLPSLKPEPATLVKRYNKNYLEKIFSILIDALVQNRQFQEVITLLKKYDIASCVSIYDYFNANHFDQDLLHRIEATVQRDIAYIVHNSPQHVLQSVEVWLINYKDEKSPYFEIASETSKHVCNLLKALFATEQYELFEKLMEIYNKYLILENHFDELRDFVSFYVKS